MANNSACYTEKPDIGIFMDEWKALYDSKSGERGIFNRASATEQANRNERRVFRSDIEITLGPTEFRLLEFFLLNPKRVYSRDQILENVWPNNINVESRTIDVHIRRLRKSVNLKNKKELIRTVRSAGYSLI